MPMLAVASAHRGPMDFFAHAAVSPILVSAAETGYTNSELKGSWLRASRTLATSLLKGGTRMKGLKLHLFVFGCMLVSLCSRAWATYPVLTFGETVTGTISTAAQTKSYTFNANAGDVVIFTVTATSGYLSPELQLLTSAGTLVIPPVVTPSCNGTSIEAGPVKLPATGTYTVDVSDCSATYTGGYAIYAQRLNNLGGTIGQLPFGQTQTGIIGLAAQSNTYTFSGSLNDLVDLTITATSGYLSPKIRLYQSNGTPVGTPAITPSCNGTTLEVNPVKLPANGTYTVLVGDCSDTYTGNYAIYAQRLNNPSAGVHVVWGQVQPGTIGLAAQSNTYIFSGTASDVIDLRMTATSGYLSPKIRLFDPKGKPVGIPAITPSCNGTAVEMSSVKLQASGTYTVLVGDCSDTYTGNYDFSSQCFGVCELPAPVLTSMSPTSAPAGSPNITLTLNGASFASVESNSVAEWGTSDTHLSTAFVSTTKLTAVLPHSDLLTPGTYPVKVFTPPPGGGYSNTLYFTVTGALITVLTPDSAIAGGPSFTLTIHGSDFTSTSVAKWNNIAFQKTSYISPTELQVTVPASYIATAGKDLVTVSNGTNTSPGFSFFVDNPVPVLTSLSPASIIAGGSGFTLTVSGSKFVKGSLVEWNGKGLTTTYVSATELTGRRSGSYTLDGDHFHHRL